LIRLFNVYYPTRVLLLLVGEAFVVCFSFFLGTLLNLVVPSQYGWLRFSNALFIEGGQLSSLGLTPAGYLRILGLSGVVLLLSHGFDLYDSSEVDAKAKQWFRLLFVLGVFAFVFLLLNQVFPSPDSPALAGFVILIVALLCWRWTYAWLVSKPFFRERVYVLGTGERADRLVRGLDERKVLGIDVVGWTGGVEGELTRDLVASHLVSLVQERRAHRVIVAMPDRRGTLPVGELLDLRLLAGVKIEEAKSWLERITGRIEVEQLNPSWLIFAEGFRYSTFNRILRRVLNFSAALVLLMITTPLLPFVALAVKLSSAGPILYRQKRVGRVGAHFYCYKFRTMRQDAEADTGATWALDNDPRITRVGKILRIIRLDEIPQLWCVLKGDMHFVGPRPERPEFVAWLSKEIPYYGVRHTVRPGITGWAQVQYKYGNTLEDAREKLQYDLYYIKNSSIGLDVLIMFQTIKIVILGRGAR